MNPINRITGLLTILWLTTFATIAQEEAFMKDIESVSDRISNSSTVAMEIRVKVTDLTSNTAIYNAQASLYKDTVSSLHILGEQEYLRTPGYFVNLDREDKMIMVADVNKIGENAPQLSKADIKELLKLLKPVDEKSTNRKVVITGKSNNVTTYKITGLEGYKSISMAIDGEMNTIKWIELTYDGADQLVRLDYTRFEYNKDVSAKLSTSNYFSLENNSIVLSQKYNGYKLFTEL